MGLLFWIFCLATLAGCALVAYQYRQTKAEARIVFNAARRRGEFSDSEAFAPFERAFLLTSDLRVGVYRILAAICAMIPLPITVSVVSFIWARFYFLLDRPAWMTEGELVHSFFLAVTAMLGLVGVAAFFARRYHERHPLNFDQEWEKAKSEAVVSSTDDAVNSH